MTTTYFPKLYRLRATGEALDDFVGLVELFEPFDAEFTGPELTRFGRTVRERYPNETFGNGGKRAPGEEFLALYFDLEPGDTLGQ